MVVWVSASSIEIELEQGQREGFFLFLFFSSNREKRKKREVKRRLCEGGGEEKGCVKLLLSSRNVNANEAGPTSFWLPKLPTWF